MIDCQCITCAKERPQQTFRWPIEPPRVIVCDLCSDKRCPHGIDHRTACIHKLIKMNFIELLTYLSADPELENRNRKLIEQKKAELGHKYAHHKKNHVTRKDGRVFSISIGCQS